MWAVSGAKGGIIKDMTFNEVLALLEERLQCDDIAQSAKLELELLRRFEAMKCCGNCKLYLECFQSCYYRICDNWQSDGLTRAERSK